MSKLILWKVNYRTLCRPIMGWAKCHGNSVDSDRVDKLSESASGMAECSEQTRHVSVLYEAAVKHTADL
jgi:hypothetical protein